MYCIAYVTSFCLFAAAFHKHLSKTTGPLGLEVQFIPFAITFLSLLYKYSCKSCLAPKLLIQCEVILNSDKKRSHDNIVDSSQLMGQAHARFPYLCSSFFFFWQIQPKLFPL